MYKAYYKSEENKIIEVAVKTVKCVLLKLLKGGGHGKIYSEFIV